MSQLMDESSNTRGLSGDEITKLLTTERMNQQHDPAARWPVLEDMLLLAQAVNERSHFVTFTGGKRYVIRYKSRYKAVFISPDDPKLFVPCGYFGYENLQGLLKELKQAAESDDDVSGT